MESEPGLPAVIEIDLLIDWSIPPLDAVPIGDRALVVDYKTDVAGIPDCFDGLDDVPLLELAVLGVDGTDPDEAVDGFVRAHLRMLDAWYEAIDAFDARVRDVGGLPAWAEDLLRDEAEQLFVAGSAHDRAVITHHHGSAGPRLSAAYGLAYALSNGTISPFADRAR